jgi:hypothetical protein
MPDLTGLDLSMMITLAPTCLALALSGSIACRESGPELARIVVGNDSNHLEGLLDLVVGSENCDLFIRSQGLVGWFEAVQINSTVTQAKRTQMPSSPTPVSSVVHVSPADTGSARVSVPVVTISPAASGGLT